MELLPIQTFKISDNVRVIKGNCMYTAIGSEGIITAVYDDACKIEFYKLTGIDPRDMNRSFTMAYEDLEILTDMETNSEKQFSKGSYITTNDTNIFEVIDSNEYQIVCKNILTNDFEVLTKREFDFKLADTKTILFHSLVEILDDIELLPSSRTYIMTEMNLRINKWLK